MFQPTISKGSRMRGTELAQEERSYGASAVEVGTAQRAAVAERILFISDDEQFRALLCGLLAAHGYSNVLGVDSLTALVSSNARANIDIAIVDTSVSYADAVRAFRTLKKGGNTSIVVIVANGYNSASADLATNGDVLLAKPFDPRELVFIVRGMLHTRGATHGRRSLSAGPITLHTLLNTATVATREIDLTGAETRVLEELLINASNPVTRDRLTRRALGRAWSPFDRCLDTHINRLRRKIGEDLRGRTPIRTIRSIGYLMLADWEPRT
jgi:DNA-binding response OmpR family regulator